MHLGAGSSPRQGQERKGVNNNQSSGALALQQPTPPENTALLALCLPSAILGSDWHGLAASSAASGGRERLVW